MRFITDMTMSRKLPAGIFAMIAASVLLNAAVSPWVNDVLNGGILIYAELTILCGLAAFVGVRVSRSISNPLNDIAYALNSAGSKLADGTLGPIVDTTNTIRSEAYQVATAADDLAYSVKA